jgi:hypothetical protein
MVLVDKEERAPQDLTRVGLDEEWEVRYWCAHFDSTEEELRACVLEVGPRVPDIEQRLRGLAKKVFKNTGED